MVFTSQWGPASRISKAHTNSLAHAKLIEKQDVMRVKGSGKKREDVDRSANGWRFFYRMLRNLQS
jgi:hypothetical protein